jgi:hypothetical protein
MKKLTANVSGTLTSAAAGSATDASRSWTADEWTPGAIEIVETDEVRNITGNTATRIDVSPGWVTTPAVGNAYSLSKKSFWEQEDTYADEHDNENGEGDTSIAEDLS